MQSNAGENQYHRALCCKGFLSWNHIKQQMKIHTWENPYHCSLCGKEVISGRKIKSHMKSHDREKPYPRTEQRDTLQVLLGRIHINVLGVANNHTKRRMKSLSQDTGQYNDQQRVRDSLLLRETSGLRPVSSSHLIPSLSLYLSPMAHSFIRISLPGGVGFFCNQTCCSCLYHPWMAVTYWLPFFPKASRDHLGFESINISLLV